MPSCQNLLNPTNWRLPALMGNYLSGNTAKPRARVVYGVTRQHVCPLPDKSLLVQAANGPIYEASPAAIMGAGDRESTLGLFKNAGLIANGRTNITILDAAALQATACECYAVVKERYKVLLPMTQ